MLESDDVNFGYHEFTAVKPNLDITVIGAGAAGLMAGIFAGRTAHEAGRADTRIAVLDGARKIGAKILISGGGRCNVTHDVVDPQDFFGSSRNSIAKVLRTFNVTQTVEFFEKLGVRLKREDTGKLFPVTDSARTILDSLIAEVEAAGATLRTSTRVTAVRRAGSAFALDTSAGVLTSAKLIVATGGLSIPKSGSDGVGYELVRELGHTVSVTSPALVPLLLPAGHWLTTLSGLSSFVELSLLTESGKVLRRERGSLLMTHFGLSGPVVLDMSRHWNKALRSDPGVSLSVNFQPDHDQTFVDRWLLNVQSQRPRLTIASCLGQILLARLAHTLLVEQAKVSPERRLAEITREERRRVARAVTQLDLPIVGDRGYNFAEVTAGGVPLSEIDLSTMASRRCPGLYLCGEILDVDGRIGGYNFQWAWASGRLAGISAVLSDE